MKNKRIILIFLMIFVVILTSSCVFAQNTDDSKIQQDDMKDIIIQSNENTPITETVESGSNSSAIQEKINNLNDGDTLEFESGTYENISVYVNKSIKINGNGAILKGYGTPSADNTPEKISNTTANGGYGIDKYAILFIVNTNNVTLNGITFIGGENSASIISSALVYAKNTNNLKIYNNTFEGACSGLYTDTCADGMIYNNTIKKQSSTGILNFASARTLITNNTVIDAKNHGIDVRHGTGPNVRIINNTVIASKEGLYLMHSKGHVATNNTLINCSISSVTCYGSGNIKIYNNTLKLSRIGILLAVGYSNITIGENNYSLYRLPMPPIFTYYIAEAKSDYQGKENIIGTFTDVTKNQTTYNPDCEIPEIQNKIVDYAKLMNVSGNTVEIPDNANSSEIQNIINSLNNGDAISFAENGKYYNISIYTEKNIKIIGNNATLYGLSKADITLHPQRIMNTTANGGYGIIYMAVLYAVNNTNVSISNLNIVSNYPNHNLSVAGTPTNPYKTAGIYAFKSQNILITNCSVDGASFGIMLHFDASTSTGCVNAIVSNNYVTNQYTYGILNFGSKNSYIVNNTVVNAKWHGIDVRHGFGPNVVVFNNTVIGSSEGIYVIHSQGHKVYNNTIINSSVSSISVYGSVASSNPNNIYIFNNTLTGSRIGILLGGGYQKVTIGLNKYTLDAQKSGDKPGFGQYLVQSEDAYSDVNNVNGTYNDQKSIVLTAEDATAGYKKGTYTIKVSDSDGNPLANKTGTVTLNNVKHAIKTDENGVASINLNLTTGTYDVETSINSDYYYSSAYKQANLNVTDDRTTPVIDASDKNIYLKDSSNGFSYQVILKDNNGNILADKNIVINYNNVNYKATTNSNGVATVTLKSASIGSKQVLITFDGDDAYLPTTKTATIKVSKEASKITASKKTFKAKAKTKKYTITLKSKSNKVISKVKVSLKINGKTYKATTNNKGKATFKIKLTKKGKFTTTVKFGGNNYFTKSSAKVKITIK